MANPDVFGSVPSHVIDYPYGGGGGSIVWVPITAADFVSTNAFTDPNAVVNNPISIHASNGDITFDIAEKAVPPDGMAEGATWRLNWPASWKGDGTQMMIMRLTPVTLAAVGSRPMFGLGVSDQGGDATAGGAGPVGMGMTVWAATTMTDAIANNTSGVPGTNTALLTSTPYIYGWYHPGGPTGDEAQVGAPGGTTGTVATLVVEYGTGASNWSQSMNVTTALSGGFYPVIWASLDQAGAGTFTATIKFEWAIVDRFPLNEFA